MLKCVKCRKTYPIRNYIARFVKMSNYATNFGFQWEKYNNLRSDKFNKTEKNRRIILKRTGWSENYIKGKLLLECGCGAGNDTETLLALGANVISFDFSNSVETALKNNEFHPNLLIFQGDIYNIPLKEELFDIVYCHRVIQHTPDPEAAFYSMRKYLKKKGVFFLHSYALNSWTKFHYHYILRIFTKRINFKITYKILQVIGPILYPIVGKVKKIKKFPFLKDILLRLIPFDNHSLKNSSLTKKEKYYFSLLHVFDRLTPQYDNPNTVKTVINWFKKAGFINIKIKGNDPILVIANI